MRLLKATVSGRTWGLVIPTRPGEVDVVLPSLDEFSIRYQPHVTCLPLQLHRARADARFDRRGNLVPLQDQDRSRWNHELIADATRLLHVQLSWAARSVSAQAAIVACHAEAGDWDSTDWEQIVLLYDMLLHLAPSPLTRLHRAIAQRYVAGPEASLAEVALLADGPTDYYLYHATRAELLRALGNPDTARLADQQALALTTNPAEQVLLRRRISPLDQ